MSVPKKREREIDTWRERERERERERVEMEVDETKKKKKKCEVETIQRRGGKTEVRERKWILKFGGEKSRIFFFHSISICKPKLGTGIYPDMAKTALV